MEQYTNDRRCQQDAVAEACSFNAGANKVESWIKGKVPLCQSQDYGEDEPSGLALLQLHARLEEEIQAYEGKIQAINSQGEKLIKSGISSLNVSARKQSIDEEDEYEWVDEVKMVPQEVMEEVVVEKVNEVFVAEHREVPTVTARYPFRGQDVSMVRGEKMFLLSKTNNDYWNVRKSNGDEGHVPANFVRESEPQTIYVRVRNEVKLPEKRMVPRTRIVEKTVRVKKRKPKVPPRGREVDEPETVEQRLQTINSSYDNLCDLAKKRHLYLKESIKLFPFMRECQDFETWMREKEKLLKVEAKGDDMEAATKRSEQFLTDLSAASMRAESIDEMVKDFEDTGHGQLEKIKMRQKQIHDQWAHFNRLKQQKELSLQGASSLELFHRTCDEARDRTLEEMEKLNTDESGRNLKADQSQQRKHDQHERKLASLEPIIKLSI